MEEIAGLPLHPRHVLIIENKQSALPVPDWPGVVIIHSLGNFLDALTAIPWIAGAQTWYWGDLDRAGFTLLSRARTRLPGVTSALMDRDTLSQHIALAVKDPTVRIDPTLTTEEHETLAALTDDGIHFRLEQERIPWKYVHQILVENLVDFSLLWLTRRPLLVSGPHQFQCPRNTFARSGPEQDWPGGVPQERTPCMRRFARGWGNNTLVWVSPSVRFCI